MSKIILIAIFVINILRSSASPIKSQKTFTIREKYEEIVDRFINDNATASAFFRLKDKDCLEQLLKLKTLNTEITKKFWKFDIEAILEGAAASCNEDAVKESFKNMMMIVEPFGERYLNPNVNCFKNELYKLEPTATILDGFTPSQELENSEVCKEKVGLLSSLIEKSIKALRKSTEYPQCLSAADSFNIKVLKLKLHIIKGDDITDQKVKEETLKVAKYSIYGTKSTFECIMDEVSKSV
ncbi:unnamed protein product [Chironomus riparius]|uniref:Uncharacterized protein n=1 Tax=Chironomus riparius TaxID=315576 RepID=A0A9N9S897_9DIPT|nr:unnamed protein product [Chironomus riparius]